MVRAPLAISSLEYKELRGPTGQQPIRSAEYVAIGFVGYFVEQVGSGAIGFTQRELAITDCSGVVRRNHGSTRLQGNTSLGTPRGIVPTSSLGLTFRGWRIQPLRACLILYCSRASSAIINTLIRTSQAQVTAPVHHKKAFAMMAYPLC
jgi:hypothetical protein